MRRKEVLAIAAFQADRIDRMVQTLSTQSQYELQSNREVVTNIMMMLVPNEADRWKDDDYSFALALGYFGLDLASSWGWPKAERPARFKALLLALASADAHSLRVQLPTLAAKGLRTELCDEYLTNLAARARCTLRRAAWSDVKLRKWLKHVAALAKQTKMHVNSACGVPS